jgi:hypothetical protein
MMVVCDFIRRVSNCVWNMKRLVVFTPVYYVQSCNWLLPEISVKSLH